MGRRVDTGCQTMMRRLLPVVLGGAVALLFQEAAAYAQSAELDEALRLNDRAVDLYERGKYDEAIQLAERALRLSRGGSAAHTRCSAPD